ncbi:MAG: NUDIX domain-containing protein [Planctomycetota bacterium]
MTSSVVKRIGIAIVEYSERYLVGTRGPDSPLAGYAEFPGGKCLVDEEPATCAMRECFEETGLTITVERLMLRRDFTYPHASVDLHFFLCHPADPFQIETEQNGFRWVPVTELPSLKFPEANEPVVHLLKQMPFRHWSRDQIYLVPNPIEIAAQIYSRVCRTDFTEPGFCVVNLGSSLSSVEFRHLMVNLTREMAILHERQTGKTLIYISAGRFDQQTTTRPHLDGGPEESLLMLGYEPTRVQSEVEISDYTQCSQQMGISPKEFMAQHNPMFHAGFEFLRPYAYRLNEFHVSAYQIVVINNSSAPIDGHSWLGVLHTATILTPDESQRRVINSTMIAPALPGTPDVVPAQELQEFIQTSLVLRKGYDKPHLEDDLK